MPTLAHIRPHIDSSHRSGWTLAGWFLGIIASLVATAFLSVEVVVDRVPLWHADGTPALDADGYQLADVYRQTAWSGDGALGLVVPIIAVLVVWALYAFARGRGRPWQRLTALVAAFVAGYLLRDPIREALEGGVEWRLVFLGLAAAMVILASAWIAHEFYARRVDEARQLRVWIGRTEAALTAAGIDPASIP